MLSKIRNHAATILFAVSMLLVPSVASAVTVSGTIADPVGNAWANSHYVFSFLPPPGGPPLGTGESTATVTGTLNASGAFSGVVLGNNDSLGGFWQCNITAPSGQTFGVVFRITASSSSLSTVISAASPLITIFPYAGTIGQNMTSIWQDFTNTWTWGAATGSAVNPFTVTDTASNTGTGALVNFLTASSSALNPFQVTAGGAVNGFYVDTSGNLNPVTVNTVGLGIAALPWKKIYLGASATSNFILTGTAGQATTVTFPDPGVASATLVYRDYAQTLTNKTLTAPVALTSVTLTAAPLTFNGGAAATANKDVYINDQTRTVAAGGYGVYAYLNESATALTGDQVAGRFRSNNSVNTMTGALYGIQVDAVSFNASAGGTIKGGAFNAETVGANASIVRGIEVNAEGDGGETIGEIGAGRFQVQTASTDTYTMSYGIQIRNSEIVGAGKVLGSMISMVSESGVAGATYLIDANSLHPTACAGGATLVALFRFKDAAGTTRYLTVDTSGTVAGATTCP